MRDARDEQARAWLVRLNSGRATEADRAAHVEWCREPSNADAWKRAHRAWSLLGRLGSSAAEVDALVAPKPERTHARRAVLAAAVTALLLGGVWSYRPYPIAGLFADAATAPGVTRTMTLADGSRIALNGATAIDVRMNGDVREVELLAGEAMFEVTHDAGRPFTVSAGGARVTVTGTRFTVRKIGDRITMMLAEGSVTASSSGDPSEINARPGQRVEWEEGHMTSSAVPIAQIGAWRGGRMVFLSRSLAEVLDELSLYRSGRIAMIGDVGRLRVTGAFDTARPEQLLASLPESLPVTVTEIGPITILRHAD